MVTQKLQAHWAPQQIAGWLAREYENQPQMQVSHETIYRTLYVQARGALKKELTEQFKTGGIPKPELHTMDDVRL